MKKASMLSKVRLGFGILISLLFIILGLLPLKAYITDTLAVANISHWTSTTGTVTAENIIESSDRYHKYYGIDLEYQFSVKDKLFTGKRYSIPDITFNTKNEAQSIIAAHPLGSVITIYYDSQNPDYSSVQNPRGNLFSAIMHVVGLIMVIFLGVFLLRYQIKNRKVYS